MVRKWNHGQQMEPANEIIISKKKSAEEFNVSKYNQEIESWSVHGINKQNHDKQMEAANGIMVCKCNQQTKSWPVNEIIKWNHG